MKNARLGLTDGQRMQKGAALLWLILLLFIPRTAWGETAADITSDCQITASGNRGLIKHLLDDDYKTDFFVAESRNAYVEITAAQGDTIGGLYIKWCMYTSPCRVDVLLDGQWVTAATGKGDYHVDYFALPENTSKCRVCPAAGEKSALRMTELRVYSGGAVPPEVQRWEPVAAKCDLLVIAAHPDDEFIFMGGAIPYYHARGKTVEVMYLAGMSSYRKLELLDGLWLCGIRNYPIMGPMRNHYETSLYQLYKKWSRDRLYRSLVDSIRMCRPDVIVTHDVCGEYGHAAHKAAADAAIWAVSHSADALQYPDSAERYGVWQPSKLYLHLYGERPVVMDWRAPQECYQGESALSVAARGFAMHRSQQGTDYEVLDEGPYDNRLFGLYFSTVGDDVMKNDFLENLPDGLRGTLAAPAEPN